MKKIIIELFILLGIGLAIWIIIAQFNILPENPQLIDIKTEERLGNKYLEIILEDSQFKPIKNNTADSLLEAIGLFLIQHVDDPKFEYQFIIVENEQVNAFSLPGGNIIVNTGLIKYCDTTTELMAVLAHEIGHSEKRHVINRLIQELGLEIILSGDDFVIGEASKMMLSTGYSRKQEEHADKYACELLLNSKIEPRTLASLFRKLKDDSNPNLEFFEMISSHPNLSSRIKYILSYEIPVDFEEVEIDIKIEDLKMLINS